MNASVLRAIKRASVSEKRKNSVRKEKLKSLQQEGAIEAVDGGET